MCCRYVNKPDLAFMAVMCFTECILPQYCGKKCFWSSFSTSWKACFCHSNVTHSHICAASCASRSHCYSVRFHASAFDDDWVVLRPARRCPWCWPRWRFSPYCDCCFSTNNNSSVVQLYALRDNNNKIYVSICVVPLLPWERLLKGNMHSHYRSECRVRLVSAACQWERVLNRNTLHPAVLGKTCFWELNALIGRHQNKLIDIFCVFFSASDVNPLNSIDAAEWIIHSSC